SVKVNERTEIISKFAENSAKYRVLLTNTRVGSTGIDLDDKHGDRPRVVYLIPEYNITNMIQACGRFQRGMDTKSRTQIYIVHIDRIEAELRMLDILRDKNHIVENLINRKTMYSENLVLDTII